MRDDFAICRLKYALMLPIWFCVSMPAVAAVCDALEASLNVIGKRVYVEAHGAVIHCLSLYPNGYVCGSDINYQIESQLSPNGGRQLRNKYIRYDPPSLGGAMRISYTEWETCKSAKDQGNPQPQACKAIPVSTPHPIHTSTGNKYWRDSDYQKVSLGGLSFNRDYNSQNTTEISTLGAGTLGAAWRHGYDSSITAGFPLNGVPAVLMARSNGKAYSFAINGATYTSQDTDITDQLVGLTDAGGSLNGYRYNVAADNSVETYSVAGKLVSLQDRAGNLQILAYSDSATPTTIAPKEGLLIRVSDSFGRQLNFTYDSASRIRAMTDPAGEQYLYSYDANNNLGSVTYPDGKVKAYLYNESTYTGGNNLPHALTGIVDENGVRYASYWYDSQGRAYKEERAGGVDRYQIAYGSDGSNSTITDPLGTARTTNFTTILGVIKGTGQSQPGGSGCGPASSAITYDANGNVASRTDFNRNKVCYAYDLSRNLETARLEGLPESADCISVLSSSSLPALARKFTTQWHPTYSLPILLAEPKRITRSEYDPSGNLMTKTIQATNDVNGSQGGSAAGVGASRIWRYTYNQYGQVLTATGPRTDLEDKTTYAYDDASGNLLAVTNAAGHVTTYSNYDANGRVGRIVDANGLSTDLEYSPRGWLIRKTVTGNGINEVTTYDYDGVGQLKQVTLPDGSWVAYTYDDAHRLTDIADSVGNSVHYTLDAMGNRTLEETRNHYQMLERRISRVYDALNRLQQVTGGVQ